MAPLALHVITCDACDVRHEGKTAAEAGQESKLLVIFRETPAYPMHVSHACIGLAADTGRQTWSVGLAKLTAGMCIIQL